MNRARLSFMKETGKIKDSTIAEALVKASKGPVVIPAPSSPPVDAPWVDLERKFRAAFDHMKADFDALSARVRALEDAGKAGAPGNGG